MNVSAVSACSSTLPLQRVMRRADGDASGGISKAEPGKVSAPSNTSSSDVAALFDSLASSRGGNISASELKSAFDNMSTDMQSALLSVQEEANATDAAAADTLQPLSDVMSTYNSLAGAMNVSGATVQGAVLDEVVPEDLLLDDEDAADERDKAGLDGSDVPADTEQAADGNDGAVAAGATSASDVTAFAVDKAMAAKSAYGSATA